MKKYYQAHAARQTKENYLKKFFFLGLSSANGVRYSRCKAKKQIIWNEKERQKKTQSN